MPANLERLLIDKTLTFWAIRDSIAAHSTNCRLRPAHAGIDYRFMSFKRRSGTDFVTAGAWQLCHAKDTRSGGNKWLNKTLP